LPDESWDVQVPSQRGSSPAPTGCRHALEQTARDVLAWGRRARARPPLSVGLTAEQEAALLG
jgi:hypothetical protein